MNLVIKIIFSLSILMANDKYCGNNNIIDFKVRIDRDYYNIGDTISEEELNWDYEVCYSNGIYDQGSLFSFSDYVGNIILISMNATW